MLDKKYLVWGGAGLAALAVGYVILSRGSSSQGEVVDSGAGLVSAWTPLVYSSGTGTTPIDSDTNLGGNSAIDNLADLLDFQKTSFDANMAFQNRSLDISKEIGMRNIAANENINLRNLDAGVAAALAAFGSNLNSSLIAGDKTMALTGSISAAGQNLSYTAQQVNARSKWNTVLTNPNGGGITLANGQVVKG